jgi:hypothetical protein
MPTSGWAAGLSGGASQLTRPLVHHACNRVGQPGPWVGCPSTLLGMWEYALWGLVGATANRGVVFLEAAQRVKGWPWTRPDGPGGGVYAVSVLMHLGIAAATTAALATATIISNGLIAFGIGATAPTVVKKVAGYAEKLVPPPYEEQQGE